MSGSVQHSTALALLTLCLVFAVFTIQKRDGQKMRTKYVELSALQRRAQPQSQRTRHDDGRGPYHSFVSKTSSDPRMVSPLEALKISEKRTLPRLNRYKVGTCGCDIDSLSLLYSSLTMFSV